jgi:hypothetical protein
VSADPQPNEIASRYQPRLTLFTPGGLVPWERVLKADARRVYIRFEVINDVAGVTYFIPGPVPAGMPNATTTQGTSEVKFRDRPAACVGEWYCNANGPNQVLITEELEVG